ncbi:MAG: hypothetical protein LAT66_00815 [Alkalimonas sp.]|nr:hypothetical protein [Alkalimonas sp.]
MEQISPIFGPEVKRVFKVRVDSVQPLGFGNGCMTLKVSMESSQENASEEITLQTLSRYEHYLLARLKGSEDTVLVTELPEAANIERTQADLLIRLFGASKESDFGEWHWKPDVRKKYNLPDIGYSVPHAALTAHLTGTFQIGFAEVLFWLQQYSDLKPGAWKRNRMAMSQLSMLLTGAAYMDVETIASDVFWLELGPVNLNSSDIVTIQRDGLLVAAFVPRSDGTLRCAVYEPMDAKAIGYAIGLSARPGPNGQICMRPNNWEYALDCCAGTGNVYASTAGKTYLSRWEFGLGISSDGSEEAEWIGQRDKPALEPRHVATAFGVYLNFRIK